MPKLTKKAFLQAREMIFQFQREACSLPPEISTVLNVGMAIAFQRLDHLSREVIFHSTPHAKRILTGRKKK